MCNFSKLMTTCNEKALGNNRLLLPGGGGGARVFRKVWRIKTLLKLNPPGQ